MLPDVGPERSFRHYFYSQSVASKYIDQLAPTALLSFSAIEEHRCCKCTQQTRVDEDQKKDSIVVAAASSP
jgi:hypothetical protein